MVGIRVCHELRRIPALSEYITIFTAVLLIYVPIWVLHRRKEKIDFFERTWGDLLKSLGWFVGVSVVIFPLLEILNRYFQQIAFHNHYVGGNYQGLAKFAFFHLIVVAIPEEIFYRGYLQYQLNRVWGRPRKFLGAPIGISLLLTSLLFAFSHSFIQLQWWHFSIFFPSLVFGWLRERTGSVTASSLFHALANTYSYWVALNYRP